MQVTYHLSVTRVHHGAVDVKLIDYVRRLVPPALSHCLLGIHLRVARHHMRVVGEANSNKRDLRHYRQWHEASH